MINEEPFQFFLFRSTTGRFSGAVAAVEQQSVGSVRRFRRFLLRICADHEGFLQGADDGGVFAFFRGGIMSQPKREVKPQNRIVRVRNGAPGYHDYVPGVCFSGGIYSNRKSRWQR